MGAWVPIDVSPRGDSDRGDHYLAVIGRLAPGVSTDGARLDLQRVAGELQHDLPGAYGADARWNIGAQSLRQTQFGRMLLPLGLVMTAATAVLLIACVNVAIMSLLRAVGRRREISIRFALGAARGDVDSAALDRGRRPVRPRRAWRTPPRAGRARDCKGVRARRHSAAGRGGHRRSDGALHDRGTGGRHARRRSCARCSWRSRMSAVEGQHPDGSVVGRPYGHAPARRPHGDGNRARRVAARLRRPHRPQPARAGGRRSRLRDRAAASPSRRT